jgi:hypothetical protein
MHMHMHILFAVFLCSLYTCSAQRSQKRALDPLELELGMVVSPCVGPGNQIWALFWLFVLIIIFVGFSCWFLFFVCFWNTEKEHKFGWVGRWGRSGRSSRRGKHDLSLSLSLSLSLYIYIYIYIYIHIYVYMCVCVCVCLYNLFFFHTIHPDHSLSALHFSQMPLFPFSS